LVPGLSAGIALDLPQVGLAQADYTAHSLAALERTVNEDDAIQALADIAQRNMFSKERMSSQFSVCRIHIVIPLFCGKSDSKTKRPHHLQRGCQTGIAFFG